MGRNKRVMEKIEDPTSRQQTYSKLKDRFVKKADELAILCDTDVGLLMFSPTDQVTSYSSRGSVEDIMLRVVNRYGNPYRQPNPNEQHLMQSLTQSKYAGQMVDKIAIVEAHEAELMKLNQRLREAQEKMRYYEPQVEKISSVQEADACQKFLMSAMEQIQRSKARILGGEGLVQGNENVAVASVNPEDASYAAGTSRGNKP
ncbi:agam-like MADS-box protein AGL66 isoform X1 [Capsicum annuum]|uniref:agamous-like MADS-box protein AGL66 isoform X1 n=1 Tax=Capsicum annuum TaxID=4072 RepID=UPI001FB1522A|nr:agamous-like MADS-box protein AGL66 isoform X1 [Capsicum annuum]